MIDLVLDFSHKRQQMANNKKNTKKPKTQHKKKSDNENLDKILREIRAFDEQQAKKQKQKKNAAAPKQQQQVVAPAQVVPQKAEEVAPPVVAPIVTSPRKHHLPAVSSENNAPSPAIDEPKKEHSDVAPHIQDPNFFSPFAGKLFSGLLKKTQEKQASPHQDEEQIDLQYDRPYYIGYAENKQVLTLEGDDTIDLAPKDTNSNTKQQWMVTASGWIKNAAKPEVLVTFASGKVMATTKEEDVTRWAISFGNPKEHGVEKYICVAKNIKLIMAMSSKDPKKVAVVTNKHVDTLSQKWVFIA